jgi:hypothetical protein
LAIGVRSHLLAEVFVQVLQLNFEGLLDLDDFIFAHFFHIAHISEESHDAIEGDWVPIKINSTNLDLILHEHISKARRLNALALCQYFDNKLIIFLLL